MSAITQPTPEAVHRYLWGDEDLTETRHPYSIFVESIVAAWDDGDRVDSAQRLIAAIETMVDEWTKEVTS